MLVSLVGFEKICAGRCLDLIAWDEGFFECCLTSSGQDVR